jgi:arylsulfatase A-like enzyme
MIYGALAGVLLASTYGALELLLYGPLALESGQTIGPWYVGAIVTFLVVYLAAGAAAGAVAGFVLDRARRERHHLAPFLSALLMIAFLGNAGWWGYAVGLSLFLGAVPLFAFWLLCGLFFRVEDPARTVVGSPWIAAIVVLVPLTVSRDLLPRSGSWLTTGLAAGALAIVLALIPLARARPRLARLASWKLQAPLTLAGFVLGFATLPPLSRSVGTDLPRGDGSRRPNIVLVTLDTTRADHLSAYGYPRPTTPRLERFASAATLYRHAYANGDMTLASHASIFTGLFPTEHGAHLDRELRPAISAAVPTLGELLRDAGYRNYAVVANTVFLDPRYGFARGFDRYVVPRPLAVVSPRTPYLLRMGAHQLVLPWRWTEAMRLFAPAGEIATTAETLVEAAGAGPFFLFVNFMESHRPWISSGAFRTRFPSYDPTFDEMALRSFEHDVIAGKRAVTAEELAKMHAAYDGSIAYLDDVVGGWIESLQREPWYDEALIIVTADHGELFGERNLMDHGNAVDHGLTSIPLIVKFPGQTARREVASAVSQIDLFATIAAAAGVAAPGPRFGADLAAGDPGEERMIVIESFPCDNFIQIDPRMDRMERALVKGRWKIIESSRGRHELYDMASDPHESADLSASRADVAEELAGLLHGWASAAEARRPEPTLPENEGDLIQRLRSLGYLK